MLYLVGLGLSDEKDISVRGLELVRAADEVYLEAYTSILLCPKDALETFYGRTIIELDRKEVELNVDKIIEDAKCKLIVILVVGDPFSATTHCDIYLRAKEKSVEVQVIHNASIITAVGACGLQLYRFGQTVSIPLFTEGWRPTSFFDRIMENITNNLHTLCLLDIKVKDQTVENLLKNNEIYEPPMFMTISQAIDQILEASKTSSSNLAASSKAIGISRAGSVNSCVILSGTLQELRESSKKFGGPLHSLVICAPHLHHIEEEMFRHFQVKNL